MSEVDQWLERLDRAVLVEKLKRISDALDLMWNDPYRHNRDNWNGHAKRISKAQAELMQAAQEARND